MGNRLVEKLAYEKVFREDSIAVAMLAAQLVVLMVERWVTK